jgi:hypothetical protein
MRTLCKTLNGDNVMTFDLSCQTEAGETGFAIDQNCTTSTGAQVTSSLDPKHAYFISQNIKKNGVRGSNGLDLLSIYSC